MWALRHLFLLARSLRHVSSAFTCSACAARLGWQVLPLPPPPLLPLRVRLPLLLLLPLLLPLSLASAAATPAAVAHAAPIAAAFARQCNGTSA